MAKKASPTSDGSQGSSLAPIAGAARPLQDLVSAFEELPGIGRRTAERLAYHVLKAPASEALRLAGAIHDVKEKLRHCKTCFHVTDREECVLCEDATRDRSVLCVVEQPKDLISIESTGTYRGLYHVLLGAFSPLEGGKASDLTTHALVARVQAGGIREIILATNPNFEGDGTALLVREKLKGIPGLRITRIARGMPSGGQIEHASRTIVSEAMDARREMPE
jgi:recombination protein RecR